MSNTLPFKSKAARANEFWISLYAGAWQGYLQKGKGAFIFEAEPIIEGSRFRYVEAESDALVNILEPEDLLKVKEQIERCDPHQRFIVVYDLGNSYEVKTFIPDVRTCALTPPEAYNWNQQQKQDENRGE
jgi:hypothetical protein